MFIDVLNRCSDLSKMEETVHIMKYIFPRQFHLHNVFTCKMDFRQTAQPFKDYTIREAEMKSTAVDAEMDGSEAPKEVGLAIPRLPKRLKGAPLQLVSAIRLRHQRCSYVELLQYYCPATVCLPCWPVLEVPGRLLTLLERGITTG
jgi:telomerase reverse transcriptase